ncbi:MAG TPA: hypothetical protein ENH15_06455 [Actinobacteria bacterium]|nr:hypothetical protein [Actinomycetota bacterium]
MSTAAVPTTQRRVRRIVRKFDPWTVLKVSFVFFGISALGLVLLSIVAWTIIGNIGILEEINRAARSISLIDQDVSLFQSGEQYFRVVVFFSVAWMILMSGMATLASVVYNLISDVVGGFEFSVMEEVPIVGDPPQEVM